MPDSKISLTHILMTHYFVRICFSSYIEIQPHFSFIIECNSQKDIKEKPDSDIENKLVVTKGEREVGRGKLGVWD